MPRAPLVVLDTNVLVSALLKRASKPGQILDLALAGQLQLAFDMRILREYRDVVARPKFGIDPSAAEAVLSYLQIAGLAVDVSGKEHDPLSMDDPADLPFAEVALVAQVDALVTGNIRHFGGLDRLGVVVQTPAEFLHYYTSLV